MNQLEVVDPNFRLRQVGGRQDVVFYDVRQAPFQIYGLLRPSCGCLQRLPRR